MVSPLPDFVAEWDTPMLLHTSPRGLALAVAISVCAASGAIQSAQASRPVPKTYIGCVTKGVFTNESGYIIRIRHPGGQLMDLSPWQNKRLRITGSILPSDNFYLSAPPVVIGTCP